MSSPIAPWLTKATSMISFGVSLPTLDKTLHKDDLTVLKYEYSMAALALHRDCTFKTATDGSVKDAGSREGAPSTHKKMTKAASIIIPTWQLQPIDEVTQRCGPIACSYRTEIIAIRNALRAFVHNFKYYKTLNRKGKQMKVLLVTDSQSALAALERGPIGQRHATENEIWMLLLQLGEEGVKVHLQFVYGHCGVPLNEAADKLSTNLFETTIAEIEPAWEVDCRAHLKANLTNAWKKSIPKTSHRYQLVQDRMTPTTDYCLITGIRLSRAQLVQLARIRCGESELFGRFYHAVQGNRENKCRFCHPQEAVTDDPADNDNIPVAATTSQATAPAPTTGRKSVRNPVQCPFCSKVLSSHDNLKKHAAKYHPDQPLPSKYTCEHCGSEWPSTRSRALHQSRCPQ